MTSETAGELLALCEGLVAGASGSVSYGAATLDVPPSRWLESVRSLRDDPGLEFAFFDFLTAVDLLADGFEVVLRLMSVRRLAGRGVGGLLLRTRLPRHAPIVSSLTPVFPGADWAEREVAEMFGIRFSGHPDPRRLLLADAFDGNPLRKDFVLAARAVHPWPGAHDPRHHGEVEAVAASGGRARSRSHRPPGAEADGWIVEGDDG